MGLLHGELTAGILTVFREVHAELRHGHPEVIYQRAMAIALADAGFSVAREVAVAVRFRGHIIGRGRLDLVVNDLVVIECKVARGIEPEHVGQLLGYLKATAYEVGLVLTFGRRPDQKRVVFTKTPQPAAKVAPKP